MSEQADRSVRVSVLIPVYNDPRLEGCLEALTRQTLSSDAFEVLVIDNGSDEPPTDVVSRYPFARLLSESTPGSYAARNRAIPEAAGSVLAFTDADCVPDPVWLEAGLREIESADGPVAIGGRVEVFPERPGHPTAVELVDMAFAFDQARTIRENNQAVTANLIAPQEAFDRVGPFDQEMLSGSDGEWCQRAVSAGVPLVYSEAAAVAHPARASLSEVMRKRRRTVGGRLQRNKGRGMAGHVRAAIRQVFPNVGRIAGGCGRLRSLGHGGLMASVRLAWIETLTHYAGVMEAVRVRLGGSAERR